MHSSKMFIAISLVCSWSVMALAQTTLQGGDNINTAFVINSLPFSDTGTTTGYTNDYTGNCGTDTGAPDVVYSFTPTDFTIVMVFLCAGTNFDTRLYIFEDSPDNIIACNDDFCSNQYSEFISGISCLPLEPGHTYYFVIDGYNNYSGHYTFDLTLSPPQAESISGHVFEAGQGPLSGATVRILQDGSPVWEDTTNAEGYYGAMSLEQSLYSVEASKDGYITQISSPVFVTECDHPIVDFVLVRIPPPPIGIISGNVRETDGETPIEGAVVVANPIEGGFIYTDTTSPEGFYTLLDMQTVLYDVTAYKAGFFPQTQYNIQVYSDQTTLVDFQLQDSLILCPYTPGDVNGSGNFNGLDVTYMVGYFKGGPRPAIDCHPYCPNQPDPFYAGGDVNGDCVFNGLDIMYFVIVLKGWAPSLLYCPECPPGL